MNSFQERLTKAIALRGITKAELSRRTGIGRNSISDYTLGKYEAKQDYVYLLAQALNVDEAWLMGLDVPMEKNSYDITSIYEELSTKNKKATYEFAKQKLDEQNSIISLNNIKEKENEIYTLAAHSSDPDKKYTEEEIKHIQSVLAEARKKHLNKNDDKE